MIQLDMPTPKNCADCCFATADLVNGIITLFCMTSAGRKMYAPDLISRKDRPEWCPIKEQQNVVRCKYCNHSTEWYGDKRRCFLWNENGIDVFEDGYCSYGNPKQESR